MPQSPLEIERNITSSLIKALSSMSETPTQEIIRQKAEGLANIFSYKGNLEGIIEKAKVAVDSRMGQGVSLIDVNARHDEKWVFKRQDDIKWTYSDAYEEYLKDQGFSSYMVSSMSNVSEKILGLLQDPSSEGFWDRRGLVIGHVQSGKTANYIGLIARAADAGYKFIVVIAGIHNNLRRQTQERIDEGFVGRSSNPENRKPIGVGTEETYPHPVTITTVNDDFNRQTANRSGLKLNDLRRPVILVIKKNVHTLNSLFRWLKDLNAQGDGQISDVPMLLIDDEADNASINTNREELNPTKINSMIRQILELFGKSCYVGYTATPFANIFINPESYDRTDMEKLFPRDFIYCLDPPNNYYGPGWFFADDTGPNDPVIPTRDAEHYLPLSHKKDHIISELPPSLYEAIDHFILARAIRNLRGQKNEHASMMINVSRFISVQKTVGGFVRDYKEKIRKAVKANYAMPENISSRNVHMRKLRTTFDDRFRNCGYSWNDIRPKLYEVFRHLRIFVVNTKSDEVLDYRGYEKDGAGLTAIAIGGLSLSRGLTIEGLCVSYVYRNTKMYDTLMQMGRWFGYRPGYEDLCNVYLSPDSIDWYGHISDASEELRQQISKMSRDKLSPKQFGLYVKAHPTSLLVTARNKMRASSRITFRANLSGRIVESHILPSYDEINRENEHLIKEYWQSGFGAGPNRVRKEDKGWFISDVSTQEVENFLSVFKVHNDFAVKKSMVLDYIREISERYPCSDVLLISLKENGENGSEFLLGSQKRKSARKNEDYWRTRKDRVASRNDEKIGLSDVQHMEAEKSAKEKGVKPSDFHYRETRRKPLLMLHSLDLGEEGKDFQERVPAFGMSYPLVDYTTEIEVVANVVWIQKMLGAYSDMNEEDFDD